MVLIITLLIKTKKKSLQKTIFIVGGSQGALSFSTIIPRIISKFSRKNKKELLIIQQTRKGYKEELEKIYNQMKLNCEVEEFFENIYEQYNNADYSVAWIDSTSSGKCTGKSILMIGDHASSSNINNKNTYDISKKKKITFPFFLPNFFLRRFLIKIFNFFYYMIQKRKGTYLSSWDNYFYPLDNINEWNRIYGKRGFFQIQCVFPLKYSKHGVKEILEQSSRIKHSSFLTVLKK